MRNTMGIVFAERKILMRAAEAGFDIGLQTLAVKLFRNGKIHVFANRWEPVNQINRIRNSPGSLTGNMHNHGNMGGLFKHGTFPPEPMIAKLLSMITGVAEYCLIVQRKLLQLVKKNSNSLIQFSNRTVISD